MKWLLAPCFLAFLGCSSNPSATPDAGPVDAAVDATILPPDANIDPLPPSLFETGLYENEDTETLGAGVQEYTVRYPLWTDNAEKRRFVWMPEGEKIKANNVDFWKFPTGTKVWKEFALEGKRLETRYLVKTGPFAQDWRMVSYIWELDGASASKSEAGAENVLGTGHDVPGTDDCKRCHRHQPDILIGVSGIQLNHNDVGLNLTSLIADDLITDEVESTNYEIPGKGDAKAALGYLHGNCGTCHHDTSDVQESITMRLFLTAESLTSVEDTTIYQTTVGKPLSLPLKGATSLIEAGIPGQSAIFLRTGRRKDGQMPPLGTEIVDASAQSVLEAWITSLM